jgi:hypothetical protein
MYYRVAIQSIQSATWQWKSTPLSSLDALFQWLRWHRAFPHDRLRIFSSSSREGMNQQLVRENQGQGSTSVTAIDFLCERKLSSPEVSGGTAAYVAQGHGRRVSGGVSVGTRLNESGRATLALDECSSSTQERRRLGLELGATGDRDVPYRFALPASMPQVLAWVQLLARVRREELQP